MHCIKKVLRCKPVFTKAITVASNLIGTQINVVIPSIFKRTFTSIEHKADVRMEGKIPEENTQMNVKPTEKQLKVKSILRDLQAEYFVFYKEHGITDKNKAIKEFAKSPEEFASCFENVHLDVREMLKVTYQFVL